MTRDEITYLARLSAQGAIGLCLAGQSVVKRKVLEVKDKVFPS